MPSEDWGEGHMKNIMKTPWKAIKKGKIQHWKNKNKKKQLVGGKIDSKSKEMNIHHIQS